MIQTIIVLVVLSLFSVIHFVLGIFLAVVWIRGELMVTDRNIVIFWLMLSFMTAAVGGIAAIHLARLAGFLPPA